MSAPPTPEKPPAPLVEEQPRSALGELLANARRASPPPGAQERSWRRLSSELRSSPRSLTWIPVTAAAVAVLIASAFWLARTSSITTAKPQQFMTPANATAALRFGAFEVMLGEQSEASVQALPERLEVTLQRGRVTVRADGTAPGARARVEAHGTQVEGASFEVWVAADRVVQVVAVGDSVHVRSEDGEQVVRAGERWPAQPRANSASGADFVGDPPVLPSSMASTGAMPSDPIAATDADTSANLRTRGQSVPPPSIEKNRAAARGEASSSTSELGRARRPMAEPSTRTAVTARGPAAHSQQAPNADSPPTQATLDPAATQLAAPMRGAPSAPDSTTPLEAASASTGAPAPGSLATAVTAPGVIGAHGPDAVATPPGAPASHAVVGGALPPANDDAERWATANRLVRAGNYAEALAHLDALAAGAGPFAGMSLYEAGRVRARFLGEPAAARRAFDAYRERFPSGALRPEVDLSALELTAAEGNLEDALSAADAFLRAHARFERSDEVKLLRANLLRDLRRLTEARAAYEALVQVKGRVGADALFSLAFCARELGDEAAAREALETYVARYPRGTHRQQALRALARSE